MQMIKRMLLILTAAWMILPVSAVFPASVLCLKNRGEKMEENEPVTEDFTPKRGRYSAVPDEKQSDSAEITPSGAVTANTLRTEAQSWYCRHMKNGERPPIPPEMAYIVDYDGYFLGKDEKVIYLTFDAGYENGNIEKILDVLKQENVPGAFFILENLLERNTDLVKRMVQEGHTVCNHTASHADMTKMQSLEAFAKELNAMENLYKEKTGYDIARYYRPPEGKCSEQNLAWAQELGYKTVFWSFAYADWDNEKQMSSEKALDKVLAGTHNGEVLLLHPTSATNAEILGGLICKWKEMGYRFGTLAELTGNTDEK